MTSTKPAPKAAATGKSSPSKMKYNQPPAEEQIYRPEPQNAYEASYSRMEEGIRKFTLQLF